MRLYFNQITPTIVSKGLVNNNVTIVPKIIRNEAVLILIHILLGPQSVL